MDRARSRLAAVADKACPPLPAADGGAVALNTERIGGRRVDEYET
jgi:hypothetical protein